MRDAKQYREYAAECRKMAAEMSEHKEALMSMAQLWERLAREAEPKGQSRAQ